MKQCPACAEEIHDDAIKCKHCKEFIGREVEVQAPGGKPGYGPVRKSAMATASLVCSITGIFCCFFLLPILGIIFGFVALNEIKNSAEHVEGEGMAKAGIIVGFVAIAVDTIFIVFNFVFPLFFLNFMTNTPLMY